MTSKTIKAALKEARDSIKSKDYLQAIEKCQEVLKEDPKNYMGLVLLGAAYQDSDKKEAAKYLRRAVDSSNDPTLALQGLANCAEVEELPDIYRKLLKFVPDKASEYQSKIVAIASDNKVWDECVSILKGETDIDETDANSDRIQSAWLCLAKVFLKQTSIPGTWNTLYEKALELVVSKMELEIHNGATRRYIKHLFNVSSMPRFLEAAVSMAESYPTDIYPLEWICKAYSENIDNREISFETALKYPIHSYAEKLLQLSSSSTLGLLVRAICQFTEEKYAQARDILEQIQLHMQDSKVCREYLAKCYVKLGAYKLAQNEYSKLDVCNKEYAQSLSRDEDAESLTKAIDLYEKLLEANPSDSNLYEILCRSMMKLQRTQQADEIITKLKASGFSETAGCLVAEFLNSPSEAVVMLDDLNSESFEVELLKGRKYFEMEAYQKALTCLLKATKLRPYYSECFLSLGQLYSVLEDLTRACKCFEKCIYLNPLNKTAITHLSAIYRKNEEWDLNYALLRNSAKYFPNCKWPLFQMGLHNLSLGKFDESIDSFRSALRYDLSDILCWESLADAYFQRGSFNSAMKVYQKIIELDPENSYPKLQVGVVKLTLHMYSESIATFTELLDIRPDYLPALKGAADAHFQYSLYLLNKCLFGRAKAHLQQATDYLQRVFMTRKRDMTWLWRLLANIFITTAGLSPTKAFLKVSGKLAGQEEDIVLVEKHELFDLAGRFYACAIKSNPEDSLLWHEFSLCYYHYASKYGTDVTKKVKNLKLALDASKQSIKLQPLRWQNWNLLGVICAEKEINNLALAQHCFIKALQIEKKLATAWTNLGILYLRQGEIKLANKAFGRAQQADTGFLNAWIGQAIIAERIGQSDEAMDLFRHCTQLDFHPESAIGYAYWVCSILSNPENLKEARYKYAIENMSAVPVALDSMNWYFGAVGINSTLESLSYLGFLNSRQFLSLGAIKAFELAIGKSAGSEKDKMLCNIGYSYLRNERLQEAIKSFDEVSEASFKSYIGLALARFRASQFEDSYSVYNLALEWLANSDTEKSLILLAMSSMVYAAQGEVDTKNILLQCIGLTNPPIQALFSACALGILHRDNNLIEAVMEALKPFENDIASCHHIAFLTAQIHAFNNQSKKGLLHLVSKVHTYPGRPLLRRALADYLLHIYRKSKKHMGPASKIAESTVVLELRNPRRTREMSLNASKYLAVASEAMKRVDRVKSLKLAQRAIHLNPMCQEAWDVLVSCKS